MGCLCVWSIVHAQSIKQDIKTDVKTTPAVEPPKNAQINRTEPKSGLRQTHPIRASTTITEASLSRFLAEKKSPLEPFSSQLLQSSYWSTIIAICTIEEYSCSHNPSGSNNLWGLMYDGHIIRYNSFTESIAAIDSFLQKADRNGRTTIESFRGWYCASECSTWESTVISTKEKLESLTN